MTFFYHKVILQNPGCLRHCFKEWLDECKRGWIGLLNLSNELQPYLDDLQLHSVVATSILFNVALFLVLGCRYLFPPAPAPSKKRPGSPLLGAVFIHFFYRLLRAVFMSFYRLWLRLTLKMFTGSGYCSISLYFF